MRVQLLIAGATFALALGLVSAAQAGDTYRMNLPTDVAAPTIDLKFRPSEGDAETTAAWWGARRWGGYGWGGPRFVGGGFWGGPRFVGGGFWGGPRFIGGPVWGGPRFIGGPVWGGPRFIGPSFSYYSPPVFYYYPSYTYYGGFFPCSLGSVVGDQPVQPSRPRLIEIPDVQQPVPTQPPPQRNPEPLRKPAPGGTFEYDGGPKNPVPMPGNVEPTPAPAPSTTITPRKPRIVNELLVSMPVETKPSRWVYPAYGETSRRER
ncbi:MAG: hypothetical protein U0840_15190 [Gemmataceae bacterium]